MRTNQYVDGLVRKLLAVACVSLADVSSQNLQRVWL